MHGKSFSSENPYGVRSKSGGLTLAPHSIRWSGKLLEQHSDSDLDKVHCLPRDELIFNRDGSRKR
jgi:hypothetical protein